MLRRSASGRAGAGATTRFHACHFSANHHLPCRRTEERGRGSRSVRGVVHESKESESGRQRESGRRLGGGGGKLST